MEKKKKNGVNLEREDKNKDDYTTPSLPTKQFENTKVKC